MVGRRFEGRERVYKKVVIGRGEGEGRRKRASIIIVSGV